MYLTKVEIQNYKAFDELELDLLDPQGKPQPLIALTGINGSGKTTVLEAIALACANSGRISALPPSGVRRSKRSAHVDVSALYSLEEVQELHEYLRQRHQVVAPLVLPAPTPSERVFHAYHGSPGEPRGTGVFADAGRRALLEFDTTRKWRVVHYDAQRRVPAIGVVQIEPAFLGPAHDWESLGGNIKQHLCNLEFVRLKRAETGGPDPLEPYRALTRRLFAGKVLESVTEDLRVVFRTHDGVSVDFDDLSSGERAVLALVGSLFRSELRRSIYLIDEPEQHLHPTWQEVLPGILRELATELESQFILATHSVEIAENVQAQGGDVYDLSPLVEEARP